MELLKMIRQSDLTLNEISQRSGVNRNTIQAWLYQGKAPSFYNLEAVLNTLGYDIRIVRIEHD